MTKSAYISLSDLRGFHRLANDATVGLTDLVEAMHHTIVRTPGVLGKSPTGRTSGITGLVYKSVRGVTRLVGASVDGLLGLLAPLIAERPSSHERDGPPRARIPKRAARRYSNEREALLAALNGVLGDYLVASGNPLAIATRLRASGTSLTITRAALASAFPHAGRKVLVLLHGLCMNDSQWMRDGHDHGAALARDLGYTPVYLHYNTGRHISTNGREFGDLMEKLVRAWPQPIEQLTIIGHSMGGLVARSAYHYATLARHAWPKRLDHLVFLGTPHFGAPLARAGTWADYLVGISPYTAPFARLGKVRSAGIKDLHHGNLRDEDWNALAGESVRVARCSLPLPRRVRCYAVAASKQERPTSSGAKIRGDGLVPVNSALGLHRDSTQNLALPATHRWVGYGMGHLDLLSRSEVYVQIRGWLAADSKRTK
jgi:pimeloyl-ACP methyl ester carboxylesterase